MSEQGVDTAVESTIESTMANTDTSPAMLSQETDSVPTLSDYESDYDADASLDFPATDEDSDEDSDEDAGYSQEMTMEEVLAASDDQGGNRPIHRGMLTKGTIIMLAQQEASLLMLGQKLKALYLMTNSLKKRLAKTTHLNTSRVAMDQVYVVR
ncbi:MAG: hypothetical protein R2865_13035 [Deinococcales bacterium]